MRQDALRCLTDLTESAFLFGNAESDFFDSVSGEFGKDSVPVTQMRSESLSSKKASKGANLAATKVCFSCTVDGFGCR